MQSLRKRLIVGTALGTAVVLVAAGLVLYWMMRRSLLAQFDNALRAKALTLAAMVEQDGDEIELDFAEGPMPEFDRAERPEYYEVWRADGAALGHSASLKDSHLPRMDSPVNKPVIHETKLPDGRSGRMATVRFTVRLDDEADQAASPARLTLALARDDLDVRATLARLRLVLALVAVSATIASVSVLAWLVRVGLRPLDRLAREIGRIDIDQLSARIDALESPQELRTVVYRLNEMLERLEAAFAREQALTADVAHELRTPLAGLRSTLEVNLLRERDAGEYRQTLTECLAICEQTQSLIENLLALARLDAGTEPIVREPTDIEELLGEAWKPFRATATAKHLNVRWQVESDLGQPTDPDKLRRAFSNLFENAVCYSNNGGTVSIEAARTNGELRIQIANSGSRVDPQDIPHVFERFWRGDSAREQQGGHSGLGLALCQTTVRSLGGTITADSPNGSFVITIRLPY